MSAPFPYTHWADGGIFTPCGLIKEQERISGTLVEDTVDATCPYCEAAIKRLHEWERHNKKHARITKVMGRK